MGFMACDMALYAQSVVALEAVPERAEFLQIRARQDRLPLFPVIGNAMAMPFAPESFDLITLNGVFEYIGLWGTGNPEDLQKQFLKSALRLLRPGGYLYIGIETRFAASGFLGQLDHSGLSFTSLMPRSVADVYCRFRARPTYGAEHVSDGYRTYTYTPAQYHRMFANAGFAEVSVQGIFDGYNRQKVLYDIKDHSGRIAVLEKVNPAASLLGVLRRLVSENRFTHQLLVGEVAIFGQKAPVTKTPLLWSELVTQSRTVVQVNVPFKVLCIVCDRGTPVEVLEAGKRGHSDVETRLEHAFTSLQILQDRLSSEISTLPIRWPRPLGTRSIESRPYRCYEYIEGEGLTTLLLPKYYNETAVNALLLRATSGYVALCRSLAQCFQNENPGAAWSAIEESLSGIQASDDIRQDFRSAVQFAKAAQWPLSPVHGDFTASNLLITPSNELVLIDWEHFKSAYFVGTDLVRFYEDAAADSARLPHSTRERFLHQLRKAVEAALGACGHIPADYRHVQALYIGQQIAALGGEDRVFQPLIRAYRERRPLLT